MDALTALGIFSAGIAAGTINVVVGSGSLITFPTLLAAGYSPVVANVSNTIGLVPGTLSGLVGYRRELSGQGPRATRLGLASLSGGVLGAILLLVLPGDVFDAIVPVLILLACALMAVQPRMRIWLAARQADGTTHDAHGGPVLWVGVFLTGVYGGYFGAAQGVILIALLSIFLDDNLQRLNGLKNVLAGLVNGVAALLFVVLSDPAWDAAGVLAAGAIIGGQIGASYGRRLPPRVLRILILTVGVGVAVRLLVT